MAGVASEPLCSTPSHLRCAERWRPGGAVREGGRRERRALLAEEVNHVRSFSSRSPAANTNHTRLPFITFKVLKPTVNYMLMKEHSRETEWSPGTQMPSSFSPVSLAGDPDPAGCGVPGT